MKTEQKIKAINLRKQGKSYNEIAKTLNVSKGTIFCWIGKLDWSRDIKKQLIEKSKETSRKRLIHLNNLKKVKFDKLYQAAEKEAIEEFKKLKNNPLFIAGLGIYWGEGDKNFANGQVRVSNIDSRLLKTFNIFLKKCCKVKKEKIKGYFIVYPDLDLKKCLDYWSKNINISEDKFCKPTTIRGRHKTKTLTYGICTIIVSNKYLKKKVLTWIDLFSKLF
jgi:hypothetical protein